jgi:DNA topoisomerase I
MRRKKSMREDGPKLLIVESPAKIKTISKFLGKDFRIMSTFGHIKDLPPRRLGITRDEKTGHIEIKYEPLKDKASVIADICKQAGASSEILLASDPDREGEIISWHIGQEIEKVFADPDKIHRITFNEITKTAIAEAIEHKTNIDMNMVNAQQARRILDRWVGYEVSPILWRKISKGLSAGRVQSVAVMVICDREAEIIAFKPEEYWSIHGLFGINSKAEFIAELVKIGGKNIAIKSKEESDKILAALKKEQFVVTKITEKKRAKNPPPPFMTSTLQQDAYNKLGFSVDKTMSIAQRLYEGLPLADKGSPEALITYMRTDSLRISDTAMDAVRGFISKEYGKEYLPKQANMYGKKGAQDAHEAVRPIDVTRQPSYVARYVSADEAKLYELIWKRFVACQMEAAEYFQRQVTIEGGKFMFRATGSTLMFDGFLKVYLVEDEEEESSVKIPKEVKEKDELGLKKLDPKQHFTQPPPRYTEASLVKELEKRGIGRPSTYAAILSTIQKRGYVAKEAKKFMPTDLGKRVNEMLVTNLPDVINISFTAKMEEDLDKIAQGDADRDEVLNEFYKNFKKDLVAFGGNVEDKKTVETDLTCPTCGATLVIRWSKNGEFIGCSKYPECTFTSNFTRDEAGKITLADKAETAVDMTCPQCGKPMIRRMSKYGPFIACSGYPECKYIHQEKLTMPCPSCGSSLVKRRWRGGSFWGCSKYPKCKFAIFGEVKETPCPKCKKSQYLIVTKDRKTGQETVACPDKACGYIKSE